MTPYERARGKPYAETFRCPGGALCLDFCNTGHPVMESPEREWLPNFAELIGWLATAGAISGKQATALRGAGERSPEAARKLWARAIRFREALARVLLAKTDGGAPADEDLRLIEKEYARTAPCARLVPSDDGFRWTLDAQNTELDAALRPVLESAVALMTSERMARVRRCGNSTCYWLFLDETKNRSRRWCEMASCGNLMKVRRHRERHRNA
jgi:predicted RNA-binding Zn ribbon-like protein